MMSSCPYKVIYTYLESRPKSELGLENMRVTHVWCPERVVAENIASCTNIAVVVDRYEEMTDSVDAVIIARDDVESHYRIARYFLDKGKYVMVDKPLTDNMEHLKYYIPFLESGKLLTGSGLRYKSEMRTGFYGRLKREDVLFVNAYSVLDWKKYAIHVLEAVTPIMGVDIETITAMHQGDNLFAKIDYCGGRYLTIQINKNVSFGICAVFFTRNGDQYRVDFDDNFGCFKYMLEEFRRMIQTGNPVISPSETINIITAIIRGEKNI